MELQVALFPVGEKALRQDFRDKQTSSALPRSVSYVMRLWSDSAHGLFNPSSATGRKDSHFCENMVEWLLGYLAVLLQRGWLYDVTEVLDDNRD